VGALFAPFLDKPFHMDDANFVAMARAIELPWGVVPGVELLHLGEASPNLNPLASSHPPFVPYLLRVLAAVGGGYSELPLHAWFLAFPLLLLGAVGHFANRLGIDAGPPMLAIGGSLAVLPVGHTLMADLPTTALFAAGAAAFDRALNGRSRGLFALAAVLLLLAQRASYQVAFFLPCLLLLVPGRIWRKYSLRVWMSWAALAAAAAVLLVGILFAGPLSGLLPGLMQGLRIDWFGNRLLGVPVDLGACFLFLLPLGARVRGPRGLAVATIAVVAALIAGVYRIGYPLGGSIALVALGAVGVVSVAWMLARLSDSGGRPVERFLCAWSGAALLVALVLLPFGAFRYLIPVVVPVTLLLFAASRRRAMAWLAAGLTVSLGLAVAMADYQFATAYRDFAKTVRTESGGVSPDRIWYAGDWGMKYYMGREGFRYLTASSNAPRAGDLVVLAEVARMWNPSAGLGPRLQLIDVREVAPVWPIVLMSQSARAGYYSALWGYYPFVMTRRPLERFGIFRVSR